MMKKKTPLIDEAGFTLVEMSSVVLVVSILLIIAAPVFFYLLSSANASACEATLKIIDFGIAEHKVVKGEYPSNLGMLVADHIKKIPTEPTNGIYQFVAATSSAPAKVICSKGHSY